MLGIFTLSPASMRRLTLGIRDHAALLAGDPDLCRAVFERDDHTCHVCGTRTPEGVEIDHVRGHVPCGKDGLRTICQFCHNLRHPLWAAARGRIVPVFAPDASQIDLHRLSWVMIAWRLDDTLSEFCDLLRESLLDRHDRFREMTGCASAEALFEAVMTDIRIMGEERAGKAIAHLDGFTRFVPFEVLVPGEDVTDARKYQAASRLSTWSIGGFRKIATAVSDGLRRDFPVADAAAGTGDGDAQASRGAPGGQVR